MEKEKKRTTVFLPEKVHRGIRVKSAEIGIPMTKVITELLNAYLKTQSGEKKILVDLPSWAAGEKGDRIFLTIENLKNLTALGNNENEASSKLVKLIQEKE